MNELSKEAVTAARKCYSEGFARMLDVNVRQRFAEIIQNAIDAACAELNEKLAAAKAAGAEMRKRVGAILDGEYEHDESGVVPRSLHNLDDLAYHIEKALSLPALGQGWISPEEADRLREDRNQARKEAENRLEKIIRLERSSNGIASGSVASALNYLGAEINEINRANGWNVCTSEDWGNVYKLGTVLALIHSEVSEALEAVRKNDRSNFDEEMADIVIRVIDCTFGLGTNLAEAIKGKLAANRNRGFRHGGKAI